MRKEEKFFFLLSSFFIMWIYGKFYKFIVFNLKILIFCNLFDNLSLKFVTCCKLENNYLVLKT